MRGNSQRFMFIYQIYPSFSSGIPSMENREKWLGMPARNTYLRERI